MKPGSLWEANPAAVFAVSLDFSVWRHDKYSAYTSKINPGIPAMC